MNRTIKHIFSILLAFSLATGMAPALPVYAQEAEQKTIELRMNNYSSISLEALREVANQAQRDGVNVALYLAQVVDGATIVRLKLNPKLSTRAISCTPSLDSTDAINTETFFTRYFKNRLYAIATGQKESYGQPVELVVKLDFTDWDTAGLRFYS